MSDSTLQKLAATIAERASADSSQSYTRQLLDGGIERCAKKFGEEAVETVIAALSQDEKALHAETADLLYHLLVLLHARNIALSDVLQTLEGRMGIGGLQEKASRSPSGE